MQHSPAILSASLRLAGGKRALLIGTSYADRLPGCINDINRAAVTLQRYGFAERDITTLSNEAATKQNIIHAIRELTRPPQDGSNWDDYLLYIHYR